MAEGRLVVDSDSEQLTAYSAGPDWRLELGRVDKTTLYAAGLEDEWLQLMRKLAATVKEST